MVEKVDRLRQTRSNPGEKSYYFVPFVRNWFLIHNLYSENWNHRSYFRRRINKNDLMAFNFSWFGQFEMVFDFMIFPICFPRYWIPYNFFSSNLSFVILLSFNWCQMSLKSISFYWILLNWSKGENSRKILQAIMSLKEFSGNHKTIK